MTSRGKYVKFALEVFWWIMQQHGWRSIHDVAVGIGVKPTDSNCKRIYRTLAVLEEMGLLTIENDIDRDRGHGIPTNYYRPVRRINGVQLRAPNA